MGSGATRSRFVCRWWSSVRKSWWTTFLSSIHHRRHPVNFYSVSADSMNVFERDCRVHTSIVRSTCYPTKHCLLDVGHHYGAKPSLLSEPSEDIALCTTTDPSLGAHAARRDRGEISRSPARTI
jgi:hypothetical protein